MAHVPPIKPTIKAKGKPSAAAALSKKLRERRKGKKG